MPADESNTPPDSVERIVEEMRECESRGSQGWSMVATASWVKGWADRLSSLPRSPGQHQELLGDESDPDQLGYVATHLSLALDLVKPSGDWWYLVERWADRHKWTDREPTCEVVPASPGQGEADS